MPFTVHAAWLRRETPIPDGQLFFWAEDSTLDGPVSTAEVDSSQEPNGQSFRRRSANGRKRTKRIPSHPYQIAVGPLRHLLGELVRGSLPTDTTPVSTSVWLPSQMDLPQTRAQVPPLPIAAPATPLRSPELQEWQVTGLTLQPLVTLRFLYRLETKPSGSRARASVRHLRLGNDLLFWSHGAKLVLEILAGQHYLPGLLQDAEGRFAALWRPCLLDPVIQQRVEEFIQVMPPACRAYGLADPADSPAPLALVDHFMTSLLGAAIGGWAPLQANAESAAAQWTRALVSSQQLLPLPPQPAYQLYQAWRRWSDPLYATNDANFRICLALDAPAADGGADADRQSWTLRYFLQARDDPSLLVSARQVWQERGNVLSHANRRFEQPQERLLAGLGLASRLFAPIRRSLRSAHPESAQLTTEEAYQFLKEIGPLLVSSGFGVINPAWWDSRSWGRLGIKLRLTTPDAAPFADPDSRAEPVRPATTPAGRPAADRGPIHYRWQLTLGNKVLEPPEFDQLVALGTPLVKLYDQWVELDPEQVVAAQRFMEQYATVGTVSLLQAVRLAKGHVDEQLQLPHNGAADGREPTLRSLAVDAVEVEGWLEQALARLKQAGTMTELPEPAGFQGTLRPYQRRGVGWLWYLHQLSLGACLADDMGLGKTVQAIAFLLYDQQAYSRQNGGDQSLAPEPALLICPTSVVTNWRREIERFSPALRPLVHHGGDRLSGPEFRQAVQHYDLIITSYGTARRDVELLRQVGWSNLILDEAQNIKNPRAKQSQAVRRIGAANRIALTGTPVENRLLDLWSIMEFLNPGYLGNRERFRRRYILPIERYNDEERLAELRELVRPFLLRRVKTDPSIIPDLPEKNEMVVYCPLTPEQAGLYNAVVQKAMAEVAQSQGIQRRGSILSLLVKLKQICNHPAHFLKEEAPLAGRSGKLSRLTEMLDEALSVGDRALVFTQFVEMGERLKRHLSETLGSEVLFLHGGTPAPSRDRMVEEFQQAEGGPPIFILSLRAGGVGLNLTQANHVFHFDRWWNPAVENQATDRAFRIGQTRNVQVYKFVTAGTLEERISAMIEEKQALTQNIIGSGEEWLTELDTQQLWELLTLQQHTELLQEPEI